MDLHIPIYASGYRNMFTKRFERRVYIAVAVTMFSIALGTSFGAYVLWPSHREAGYTPHQPISFRHDLHAGELKIDCLYCHTDATKGPHATVPQLSICMNCHTEVKKLGPDGELMPGLVTLFEHWESGEPVIWNKVNDVADFVYFDHSRHLFAQIDCQDCHGPVEKMVHMRREFGLKMSWCLQCHKQKPQEGDAAFERGDETRAPIHCTTCHR